MQTKSELFNDEAEQMVLGMLMTDNASYWKVPYLNADHFYYEAHRETYQKIAKVIERGDIASPITLKNEIDQNIVEVSYLFKIFGLAYSAVHIHPHSQLVATLAQKRCLLDYFQNKVSDLEYRPQDVDCDLLMADIMKTASDYSFSPHRGGFYKASEVAIEIVEDFKKPRGLYSTGIKAFDAVLGGGLETSKTYCLYARQKQGKTLLAGTIAYNQALAGHKVLYIASEMGRKEIHKRNMARSMGRNCNDFSSLYENEAFRLEVANTAIKDKLAENLIFYDEPSIRFDVLRYTIISAVRRYGVKCVFLDYIQLVGGVEGRDSKTEHMEKVSQWIADIAKKEDIFIFFLAQSNTNGQIKWGDVCAASADSIFMQHKIDMDEHKDNEFIWIENKEGRNTMRKHSHVGSAENPRLVISNKAGPHIMEHDLRFGI